VLCGGNHPANYKGCMVYKELQQKTFPSLRPKIYTPPTLVKQTLPIQPNLTYAQITKGIPPSHPPPTVDHSPTNPLQSFPSSHQPPIIQQNTELKHMMKSLFDQLGSLLNLLTTVLSKIR
jgi:hypothetical protein